VTKTKTYFGKLQEKNGSGSKGLIRAQEGIFREVSTSEYKEKALTAEQGREPWNRKNSSWASLSVFHTKPLTDAYSFPGRP
jgi:hypothetical protein